MKLVPVKSSNVDAVGYDPDSKTMHVRFKNSGTYVHRDVSEADHAGFVGSSSIGSHYHAHFRGKHSGKLA